MQRLLTRSTQVLIDFTVLFLAFALAFLFRFDFVPDFQWIKIGIFAAPYVILLEYMVLSLLGVPSMSWRYTGMAEAKRIGLAVLLSSAVLVAIRISLGGRVGYAQYTVLPISVLGMNLVLSYLGLTGVRVLRRLMVEREDRGVRKARAVKYHRTLLIGAGRAGVMVAKEIAQRPEMGIELLGFVDDDATKFGSRIHGAKVIGDTASIPTISREHQAEQAIIAIASATSETIRRIMAICTSIDLPVRIIPGVYEILDGRVNLSRIRSVTIEDLLGRDAVELDQESLRSFIQGKRVLVTGAGGSIGSEICRQLVRFEPSKLVLLEQAENSLFQIHRELTSASFATRLVPAIADVVDQNRMQSLFESQRPQVVFHAAAHKHVPLMEMNAIEAIKNNIFGTRTVVEAAVHVQVDDFVFVSTDKAVNPTSVMGATKRAAELIVQEAAARSRRNFVAVRFGNVLGSVGSVIPVFQDQIASGGPITVTHPDMQRYFMTIPEASQLVLQAAALEEKGAIYMLDMGEPVHIVDLARDLIRLSGFSESEIEVVFSGVRPGEKLFEELSFDAEKMDRTSHRKIFRGRIEGRDRDALETGLEKLWRVIQKENEEEALLELRNLVTEYQPREQSSDVQPPDLPEVPVTVH